MSRLEWFWIGMAAASPALATAQQLEVKNRVCQHLAPPSLQSVVNRKTLDRDLRAAFPDSAIGQALVSVIYQPDGTPLTVRALDTSLDSAATARLLGLVAANLKDQSDGRLPGTRLLITLGQPLGLEVEAATYCPPVSTAAPRERLAPITITSTQPTPGRLRAPNLRLIIAADGSVESVELDSSTGLAEMDEEIKRHTKAKTFRPAILDGLAIRVLELEHWR